MTDLLELITKSKGEINSYLAEVPWDQFIADVKHLVQKVSDKEPIKEAIKKLEELL